MPGTPMPKSASLLSANSRIWRGVISVSARALSSSGRSGGISSILSWPATRTVGGRPALSNRSDAPRRIISTIACRNWNAPTASAATGSPCPADGSMSAIRIHPEQDLPIFNRRGVLDQHLADHAGHLGLDLVHDLHGLDDAHRLAL